MADAMVSPWVRNQRQPSDQMRSEVLSFLRQHLGDPRVDTRQRWGSASDVTRRTVRGCYQSSRLMPFLTSSGSLPAAKA